MLTKQKIIEKVLTIRGIIDNDNPNDGNKINRIEMEVNFILLNTVGNK
jgi:hypothetical protein